MKLKLYLYFLTALSLVLQSNGQIPEKEIPFPASLGNGENESKLNISQNIADKCPFVTCPGDIYWALHVTKTLSSAIKR
mgnify:FL=1